MFETIMLETIATLIAAQNDNTDEDFELLDEIEESLNK